MRTAFITHPECLQHEMGLSHPECPERITAIETRLKETGLIKHLSCYEAPLADWMHLLRVHDEAYIQALQTIAPLSGYVQLDPDTTINPYSLNAARRGAGAVLLAADLVMADTVDNAFCAIRPPGHHATRQRAMGFCVFNHVAVGTAYLQAQYPIKRVAIIDFDVHHGNGTEDIFQDNQEVMLCSTFQYPCYPYCGMDSANDHIINIPLKAGLTGKPFREIFSQYCLPALLNFQPEFIFISAGFDAHQEDQLASLNLVEEDYEWLTNCILKVAQECGHSRIVSVLEGGYALNALWKSAEVHIRRLARV